MGASDEAAVGDIAERIRGLGGLHDCRIDLIEILPAARKLRLHVRDINWNSEGYPDYVAQPGILEFVDVRSMVMAGAPVDWIFDVQIDRGENGVSTSILLNCGDRINICSAELLLIA